MCACPSLLSTLCIPWAIGRSTSLTRVHCMCLLAGEGCRVAGDDGAHARLRGTGGTMYHCCSFCLSSEWVVRGWISTRFHPYIPYPNINQTIEQAGHLPLARLLLSRGAPVEAVDGNGSSALLLACLEGQLEVRSSNHGCLIGCLDQRQGWGRGLTGFNGGALLFGDRPWTSTYMNHQTPTVKHTCTGGGAAGGGGQGP